MVNPLNLLFQFLDSFAFIVLAAAGLAVIFGIMGVINLAHGEFIMVGAYATTLANIRLGLPLPVAMLAGVAVSAVFGLVVERVVISGSVPNAVSQRALGRDVVEPLYDRLADSMVATWGLSLIMVQGVRITLGNSLPQIGTPLGEIAYGGYSYSTYRVLLAGVAVGVLALTYYLFTHTEYGMRARATIQNERIAKALGVDTERTYMTTFAIGSGMAGLTGALYAPTVTMVPTLGSSFLVESFVAVVVGGPGVVLGTTLAGGLLGSINALFSNLVGTFFGRIALLATAIVMIRFLPDGITGFIETVRARRQEDA
ncbi:MULTISPECIES: urea ABC transporter, permease protein UrtB [Haloferax]|uniref:Branched-chain/neutral amino acids ABC transporter permease n=4 Tax=Haloferax TaxID=2251 RepID=M0I5Q0_HALVO|nr:MULTISPECIES: urea ABC transporter, permease protein UrtB [Haloferax]ELK54486.1 branched-chain/neutral amino acids ABC transporter permease [Haloferax sp. BAB-2207]ELZ70188.1 branched-chain/neutral amino acids ABC transporter permease [Haloferax lucentense DSM 14919]ELZ90709.1 branched-chain/neutral amino acids ABC transporter permease [Haloferax alexandrinus JCM 10717]MBC9984975.1 urea ABC transporter, permease protein UrtB [Haloferax sp. AS1]NLV01188.1 urea ABC transporter, permease prote